MALIIGQPVLIDIVEEGSGVLPLRFLISFIPDKPFITPITGFSLWLVIQDPFYNIPIGFHHLLRIPMSPTRGGISFQRTSVLERRFESSKEYSNSKIVFALIAIQLNPIESKLLGRIAAKAQQHLFVRVPFPRLSFEEPRIVSSL